jgi:hypothetical protein
VTRRFNLAERSAIALQVQVFNVMNQGNYDVQNGTGVNSVQYTAAAFGNKPDGSTTCGDGATLKQTCYLAPNPSFGKTSGHQRAERIWCWPTAAGQSQA